MSIPPFAELLLRAGKVAADMAGVKRGRTARKTEPAALVPVNRISDAALADTLNALDIRPGQVLMLHSDTGAIERMGWSPGDFLDFLLAYLGEKGTLLLPTHPRLRQENGTLVYDVQRSPSYVGLLTELFRRRKRSLRSAYPFSSCAAQGCLGEEMISDHVNSFAPHDEKSPYAKLAEVAGRVLCVGCALDRMTILHVAEDTCRGQIGIDNFYEEMSVFVRDQATTRRITAHRRAAWLWWYLAKYQWTAQMQQQGFVKRAAPANVSFLKVEAHPVIHWMQNRAKVRKSIYPLTALQKILRLRRTVRE